MILDECRKRKTKIMELEEFVKFKQVMSAAKIAFGGRLAAAELLKCGVSDYVFHSLTAKAPYFTINPTPYHDYC
jgi:hypothetical protein